MKKHLFALVAVITLFAPAAAFATTLRLEIDLSERELIALIGDREIERYTVAVGAKQHPTPKGSFVIRKIVWNPSWVPPDAKWARKESPKPPGHPENPMKKVKMFFREPDYYIHGTGDHESLGHARSHGCIRMDPDEATELGRLVMKHGGKPMPDPWYRRIFRSKRTAVVRLSEPVQVHIRA